MLDFLVARRVFAPSDDVHRRLARHIPDARVIHRPHPEESPALASLAARLVPGETVRVAVLGTIVAIKGSERLLACAHDARTRNLPLVFHVIGSTDRDAVFARMRNVTITGRYREEDVYEKLAEARCHLAFVPSVCPESFMFSLSNLMAARMFVFCFDLGAQAERLRRWGWGRALPMEASPSAINDTLSATARSLASGPPAPPAPQGTRYSQILTSYYDFDAAELKALDRVPPGPERPIWPSPRLAGRRDHAHLH
jgi:glycosyltransferase involved in cell wall biosynthesis